MFANIFANMKNKTPDNQWIIRGLSTQGRNRTGTAVKPLEFESSASTSSATWAFCRTFYS